MSYPLDQDGWAILRYAGCAEMRAPLLHPSRGYNDYYLVLTPDGWATKAWPMTWGKVANAPCLTPPTNDERAAKAAHLIILGAGI